MIYGQTSNQKVEGMTEMTTIEAIPLVILALLVLLLGFWPAPLIEIMSTSVENLVNHIAHSKL